MKRSSKTSNAPSSSRQPLAVLLKFYVPLAAASMLMMLTHSVVSGAIARTLYPTVALAAYSASYSIVAVLESPVYGMGRMCLTFTQSRRSFRKTAQVAFVILGVLLAALSVICWTPLSRHVLIDMLGVSEEVYRMAVPSMRVFMLWPVWSCVRSVFQVPIVIKKQTVWLTINMVVRVMVMFAAAAILPGLWPVGPVGASILMLGIGTEAVLAWVASTKIVEPLEEEAPDELMPRTSVLLRFGLPLAIASSVQTLGRPIITAALSQTANPEVALAGYQVATSFSFIFTSLTYNIYQLVIVYVKDRGSFQQIRTFSAVLGTTALVCLWISVVPQIGTWIFGSVIKVPQEVIPEALKAVAFVALMPFFASLAEFFEGILMLGRQALWVTVAKSGNMLISSLTVVILAKLYPAMGAAIGTIGLSAGTGVEALIGGVMIKRLPACRRLLQEQREYADG
ncbi:MAG: hypothetical protein ACOX35_08195 [Bacillota bacterium]